MSLPLQQIIREASKPLSPITTGLSARTPSMLGTRAVLFDIYGTLLISGSGDIGTTNTASRGQALVDALQSVGSHFAGDADTAMDDFRQVIDQHHKRSRANGILFPEVDIIEVWRDHLLQLGAREEIDPRVAEESLARLAVEFESRVNPVWPMPGMLECLAALKRQGLVMGIISNAQFFTPLLFPALVDENLDELGFAAKLQYYSYSHRCAKPGIQLYQLAAKALASQNIQPDEVLYIGNDMRNDIWPAAEVGFRTALFAGDQRSLRLRVEEAKLEPHNEPDAVLTHLDQIPQMIKTTDGSKANFDD